MGKLILNQTQIPREQWRYTLKPADLLGWEQSVTKRGIVLPTPIRDEFIALYNDAKTSN